MRNLPFFVASILAGGTAAFAPVARAAEEKPLDLKNLPAPESIAIAPKTVTLHGPRARARLQVTGKYADGTERDLTSVAKLTSSAAAVTAEPGGLLVPTADGSAELTAEFAGRKAAAAVQVVEFTAGVPPSFNNEVMAVLAKAGCSMGACHGRVQGQNGFRLSLRGPFPEDDYVILTREIHTRRIDRVDPDNSLILRKAVGTVPHEGGARFDTDSLEYRTIRDWIAAGAAADAADHRVVQHIEVLPSYRVLSEPGWRQQLTVLAHYSDKTVRDVTHLTWFTLSDENIGDVNADGLVHGKRRGQLAVVAHYLMEVANARFVFVPQLPDFKFREPAPSNFIDALVFEKLKQMKVQPSDLSSDEEFLRRLYLDVTGILPTVEEARAFLADKAPDRRAKLIDELLDRPEYADFWSLKWADVLRNNKDLLKEKGVHKFHRWIRRSIAANRPFDEFAADLLTGSGGTFESAPSNFYRSARDPTAAGETAAQIFFGIRMQCAKCHNHPFERWTQNDYYNFAAFFAGVKYKKGDDADAEVVYYDPAGSVTQPRSGKRMAPKYLAGGEAPIPPSGDPREALAAWVRSPENPFFAKATVNRVWKHLFGRGIIDPADDIRDSNPASNDELLEALTAHFIKTKFDMKGLIRIILNSRTYQLSSKPSENNADDEVMFSHSVARQLSAEQLMDAIIAVTGLPEKFPGLPAGYRATQLPDTSIDIPFLRTFGQPKREIACDCERDSSSNLSQVLQLVNGDFVHKKITGTGGRLDKLIAAKKSDAEIVEELYFAALARPPRPAELDAAGKHIAGAGAARRQGLEDVLWALLNSREFLFQH
jgi:hypothetical protein